MCGGGGLSRISYVSCICNDKYATFNTLIYGANLTNLVGLGVRSYSSWGDNSLLTKIVQLGSLPYRATFQPKFNIMSYFIAYLMSNLIQVIQDLVRENVSL